MNVSELFADGALSGEEFMRKLEESGMVILEGTEGGYVPAAREAKLSRELEAERTRHEEALSAVRARAALVCELTRHGAHNPALAATAIGIDGIGGDDRELAEAVRSKVSAFRSSEPYMFSSGAAAPNATLSTGAPHGTSGVDPDSLSDSEYYRYKNAR